jgi:hypothetical protein
MISEDLVTFNKLKSSNQRQPTVLCFLLEKGQLFFRNKAYLKPWRENGFSFFNELLLTLKNHQKLSLL